MIADFLRPAAICSILLLIEISMLPWISVKGSTPDLLLIYVLFVAARHGKNAGLLTGLFAGILHDITGGGSLGLLALAKSNLGFWFGMWTERRMQSLSTWIFLVVAFLSVTLHNTWSALFMLQGSEIKFGSYFVGDVLPPATYSAVFAYLIALLTSKARKSLKKGMVLR